MKVWVTKYALSKGILEIDGEIHATNPKMFKEHAKPGSYGVCYWGTDWHDTREGAVDQANTMQVNKIFSLAKQIERIRNLEFK